MIEQQLEYLKQYQGGYILSDRELQFELPTVEEYVDTTGMFFNEVQELERLLKVLYNHYKFDIQLKFPKLASIHFNSSLGNAYLVHTKNLGNYHRLKSLYEETKNKLEQTDQLLKEDMKAHIDNFQSLREDLFDIKDSIEKSYKLCVNVEKGIQTLINQSILPRLFNEGNVSQDRIKHKEVTI